MLKVCEQIKIPGIKTKVIVDIATLGKVRCISCGCLVDEIIEKNGFIGCKNCLY